MWVYGAKKGDHDAGRLADRIRRSMIGMLATLLLLFYFCFTLLLYRGNVRLLKQEVQREADYIVRAFQKTDGKSSFTRRPDIGSAGDLADRDGMLFVRGLDEVNSQTRVTWITRDGTVLYDTGGNETGLSNHLDRPEVKEARLTGHGEDTRMSDTKGERMYYYALRLDDGSILRVARQTDTLTRTAMGILPLVSALLFLLIFLSALAARWQTKRMLEPLYRMDLQSPLSHPVYTEMRPFVQALDIHNKEREEAAALRKEFSANVSHELKTPLTSISGYAELIEQGLVQEADVPVFAGKIRAESARLLRLIEDIMRLSRLDEGQLEEEKRDVDLYEVTVDAVERMTTLARERDISIDLTGERAVVQGVPALLLEMVFNLVENAVKYNRDKGKVDIWVGNVPEGIRLIVTDTGIGISDRDVNRIFERFYRADKSHSRQIGGTGLGLSIVKHAAMLHGADVDVTSTPGVGTKMSILFPTQRK